MKKGRERGKLCRSNCNRLRRYYRSKVFVLSGTSIALAGSYSLLAFIFIGVLSVITALILGELATILPHVKGSTYSYAFETFGHELECGDSVVIRV